MFGTVGNLGKIKRGSKLSEEPVPGLSGVIGYYDVLGLTNSKLSEEPVWKDKSSSKSDLQFKNFGWTNESGINEATGSLIFNGVDDYAVCETFPLLTKEKGYTIMGLRKWVKFPSTLSNALCTKRTNVSGLGAFIVEKFVDNSQPQVAYSWGGTTKISIDNNNPLFYQTQNSYNGITKLTLGNVVDTGKFVVGAGLYDQTNKVAYQFGNFALYSLVIIDHDTTPEERQKVIDKWNKDFPELFPL